MDPLKIGSRQANQVSGVSQAKLPATKDAAQAAQQFEALLIGEMLKSMWQTVPQGQLLSGSHEESLYRDMLNEAISNSIAEGRGMGIKDVIFKDMNRLGKSK
jgi:peptidoglycan hydrolase FlgJ